MRFQTLEQEQNSHAVPEIVQGGLFLGKKLRCNGGARYSNSAFAITVFLIASICGAQTSIATPSGVANSAPQAPTAPAGPTDTITILQGTTVPLTLVNPVKSNSTKPG